LFLLDDFTVTHNSYYAEGGLREFGKWQAAMVDRFGDSVRQYLPEVWSVVEGKLKRQTKKSAPKVKAEEPVLPGFGPAVEEQKAAAGAEVGRKLTDRFNEGPMSIDRGTGKIESAPLFRGTDAAPQREMFSPPPKPTSQYTFGIGKSGEPEWKALVGPTAAPRPSSEPEPPPEPSAGLHEAVGNMQSSIDRIKNEPGRNLENLKAAVDGLPTPESMRQKSFIRYLGKLDNAVRSGSAEDIEYYLGKVKDKGRRVLPPMSESEIQSHIDQVMKAPAPGPGGKTAGPPEVEGTPLEQLTSAIKATGKASRVKQPNTTVPLPPEIKGDSPPSKALKAVTDAVTGAWKLYSAPPATGSYMDALGEFQGHLQRNTFAMQEYVKQMRKDFPDKSRREAMTNWVQAEGDKDTLYRWASLSKGSVRKAYQAAMTLTDEEQTAARNIRNMLDSYWDIAHEAGILEGFIENYIPQIRKPASKYTSRILAEIMGGLLRTDFRFAKKRAYENYFEGEQAGFPALDKDAGFLVATYVRALVKAIEGRAMVRNLLETNAKDGRPLATVSGAGRVVSDPATGQRANFVNPNLKPEEASDYRAISHPALRKWIWAGKDAKGNPIFLQGDIIVHPEIHRHLRNVLTQSAFRQPDAEWYKRMGGTALDASSFAKQTFMGPLSTFHQVQVGLHGLMHRVNPFNPAPIDWTNPDQVGLVNGGLVVANPDGAVNFEEGLVAGGLWGKIPGIGTGLRNYKDYLFKDYIPRLKMAMGTAALERNKATYGGKLSADQIYRLTANEANAAFGEQNYIMLGRNKTVQDALRLLMLSPDFTEARARFVGQAVRPGGREQLKALAIGSVLLAVTANTVYHLLKKAYPNKKVDWHPDRPFSVRVGQYEYDARTLPGDLLGIADNFGPFVESRFNPVTAKPAWEAATGKDWRGMPRTASEQVHDYFYGLVPISMQGLTEEGRTFWESSLGAFGLRARKFYSPAGKLALEIHGEDLASKSRRHETPELLADRQEVSKLFRALNDGTPIPPEKIKELEDAGRISGYTANRLRNAKPGEDPFLNIFASLGIQDKLDVWDKAEDDERQKLLPELILTRADMRQLKSLPPAEERKVLDRYNRTRDKAKVPGEKKGGMLDDMEHIFDRAFAPIPSGRMTAPPIPSTIEPRPAPVPET